MKNSEKYRGINEKVEETETEKVIMNVLSGDYISRFRSIIFPVGGRSLWHIFPLNTTDAVAF